MSTRSSKQHCDCNIDIVPFRQLCNLAYFIWFLVFVCDILCTVAKQLKRWADFWYGLRFISDPALGGYFLLLLLMWGGGFGFGVKFGLLSTTISWLTVNAAVISGLSAVTYWLLVVSEICCPVAPKPHSQITDMETWISTGLSISGSGRVSVSSWISTSGIEAELRPTHRKRQK